MLAEVSGVECYNSAQFLGHLREGRGPRASDIAPGTLFLLDESSMLSEPDIEDIVDWAAAAAARR